MFGRVCHVRVVVPIVVDRLVESVGGLVVPIVRVGSSLRSVVSILVDGLHVVVVGDAIEVTAMVVNVRIDESLGDVRSCVVSLRMLREGMSVFDVSGEV